MVGNSALGTCITLESARTEFVCKKQKADIKNKQLNRIETCFFNTIISPSYCFFLNHFPASILPRNREHATDTERLGTNNNVFMIGCVRDQTATEKDAPNIKVKVSVLRLFLPPCSWRVMSECRFCCIALICCSVAR